MKKQLEYKDETSQKFWTIQVVEKKFIVVYGKIGTEGQSKTKTFESTEVALKEANKIVANKIKKGYKETKDKNFTGNKEDENANKEPVNYYKELKKFDKQYGGESYAQSFWIEEDEDDFFETWLYDISDEQKKEYAQSFQVFAGADGTGARYAFWFSNGNKDVNQAPIICFGSEGQIDIIACDIKDLIKILSFGQEPNDGSFYFGMYDIDDFETKKEFFEDTLEYRPNFLTFRKWMKEDLGITPVKKWKIEDNKEVNKLVKKAVKKYKKPFDKWQYQFYPNPEDEKEEYASEQKEKYEKTKAQLLDEISKTPTAKGYYQLSENEKLTYDITESINHKLRKEYLKKAAELDPKNLNVLKDLAELQTYPKNIETFKKLLEVHDAPEEFYSDIASIYKDNENYKDALDYYLKSIQAEKNGWDGCYHDYVIDICQQLKINGIEVLEKTIKDKPNSSAYKALYKQYFKKKDYQKAAEYAEKYIDHTDIQAHNYMDIANKFLKKKAYKEVLPILEKTVPRHSWDDRKMRTLNNIGLCHFRITPQDIDKALVAFMKAYKLVKNEPALHQNLYLCGKSFYDNRQHKKAIKVLEFCVANFEYEKENSSKMIQEIKNK